MRTIIHISDIHFGKVDYKVAAELKKKIGEFKPDLVVISGDLTQRARSAQFVEARAFLDSLPQPQIVVPGNHDIPMHNVIERFAAPLDKYKKFITNDLQPFYADGEIAAAGINTARSLTIKDGRINEKQIENVREKMSPLPDEILKIIVTHHPFDLPAGHTDEDDIVDNAVEAMEAFANCGADVFLSGHLHVSHISHAATRYKLESGHRALIIQAGTATSTRGRGEANSFNVLEFEYPNLTVKRYACEAVEKGFELTDMQKFEQFERGWRQREEEELRRKGDEEKS